MPLVLKVPGNPGWLARFLGIGLAVIFGFGMVALTLPARAETPLPPKPNRYFNDYAKVVPGDAAERINGKLEAFERATSNQILVAVFPKLPDGTFLEDYTVKTAQSWGPGGEKTDNGLILFVFIADRKIRIEVGYGLEGVVPDSIAKSIIVNVIQPKFRQNDYAGGLEQGVEAIFKATRNEYKGTGKTVADANRKGQGSSSMVPFIFMLVFIAFIVWVRNKTAGAGNGWHSGGGGWFPPSGGFGGGGFGGGGGSFGGGGGGGFSGGGGSFGGGGSSGDW